MLAIAPKYLGQVRGHCQGFIARIAWPESDKFRAFFPLEFEKTPRIYDHINKGAFDLSFKKPKGRYNE